MSYKKCWAHLKILAQNLDEELVNTKRGGKEDAGTTLNPRAYELMNAYKQLQRDIKSMQTSALGGYFWISKKTKQTSKRLKVAKISSFGTISTAKKEQI
ncbi:winged helix-turn-helix domain-containing protein [Campylobacter curvus]|uniref:winged helix-turn-helix domain-containing protein n=1 Tax=Campylobacter curvus TaxID=200 RepID=UPI002016442B|nr:LysR family transcriptional regulator [Campylobacter curvus]